MPVLEIEREAREAGLLGPHSPISQNKSFRSARDMLEISPRRKGGAGAKGQWVWELPTTPKMPDNGDRLFSLSYSFSSNRRVAVAYVGGIIGLPGMLGRYR